MNEVFRRRLIGLAVLLVLVFLLSLLLPGAPARDELEPSTTVSLSGEILQVTEADAVPPPDDYLPPAALPTDAARPAPVEPASADPVLISDLGRPTDSGSPEPTVTSASEPQPDNATGTTLKLAPKVSKPDSRSPAKPGSAAVPARPASPLVAPRLKLAETVSKPAKGGWFVQIGSFSEAGTATTIVSLIRKQGYPASTSTINGAKGKTLHRVRAGPYSSEAAARSARARIVTQGYPQAQVVAEASR